MPYFKNGVFPAQLCLRNRLFQLQPSLNVYVKQPFVSRCTTKRRGTLPWKSQINQGLRTRLTGTRSLQVQCPPQSPQSRGGGCSRKHRKPGSYGGTSCRRWSPKVQPKSSNSVARRELPCFAGGRFLVMRCSEWTFPRMGSKLSGNYSRSTALPMSTASVPISFPTPFKQSTEKLSISFTRVA